MRLLTSVWPLQILRFTGDGEEDPDLFPASAVLREPLATPEALPLRRDDIDFGEVSKVVPRKGVASPPWRSCMTGPLASRDDAGSENSIPAAAVQAPRMLPPATPAPSAPATGASGGGGTVVTPQAPVVVAIMHPPATPSAPDLRTHGQQRTMPPPAPVDPVHVTQGSPPEPQSRRQQPVRAMTSPALHRSTGAATFGTGFALPAAAGLGAVLLCFWLRSKRRRRAAAAAFQGLPQVMVPSMSPFRAQTRGSREE